MSKIGKAGIRLFFNSRGYLIAIASVALATWLKYLAQPSIIPADVPILYLLAIVPTAIFFGFGPSILVCLLSALAYDYYFISPIHQFIISDIKVVPILAIFLAVGILFSYLASNLRRQNEAANKEITARKQSEAEVAKYRDHLEELVQQRTSDLEKANTDLKQEISERKKAEEQLFQVNRELRAISECDRAMMRATNKHEFLIEVCNIICGIAGYRMAWVGIAEHDDAKSVRPMAWGGAEDGYLVNAAITWADTERGRGPTGLAVRTGKTHFIQDFASESKALPWREAALARGYCSSIAIPLFDTAGIVLGALTVYAGEPNGFTQPEVKLLEVLTRDLDFGISFLDEKAKRKQSEEVLRETSDYLDNLFNYANAPIIVWDTKFRVTRFNHAFERLTGRTTTEVMGKSLDILFPEDSREHFMELIRRVHIDQRMEVEEIPIVHKDGSVRTVLWNSATLYAPDDKAVIATIAQGQDITERKKSEEELRQRTAELQASNKELEAFSYSVSHDLRAPLRGMAGFSSALMEDYSEKLDEDGKRYLRHIQESSNLMGQLIDDLLKLSRVTRSEMNREKVNLSEISRKIVLTLRRPNPTIK